MKGLAKKRGKRRSLAWRVGETLGVLMGAIVLLIAGNLIFGLRESGTGTTTYRQATNGAVDQDQVRRALLQRIRFLRMPPQVKGDIGRDRSGRLIEAGLLYGRLALLEERAGNLDARDAYMAEGVALLRQARVPDASEAHIRDVIAKQDAANLKK